MYFRVLHQPGMILDVMSRPFSSPNECEWFWSLDERRRGFHYYCYAGPRDSAAAVPVSSRLDSKSRLGMRYDLMPGLSAHCLLGRATNIYIRPVPGFWNETAAQLNYF